MHLLTPISILDTQLADRTSRLTTSSIPAESQPTVSSSQASLAKKPLPGEPGQSLQETLAATRADLSDAQRSRSELQEKLNHVSIDLEKLRKKSTQDARRISTLESQRTQLQLRLKDRDEELRGKAKLLDDFQDELATLNLQLNMAEDKSNRLQRENQDLVDRWMARMGKEAEAMNDASKFS
ncbi:autophagy protein [Aspergillus sclerotialis]|uniref:Autophagy protein n=1 Tax=Aspergillus sclerotialis TaxID=2070753 RepID=A0A3A3A058_9EURO|nr:autophagy protein [Aspergillus sclerotialis]